MKITKIGHRISDGWSRFKDRYWRALGHLTKPAILVMLGRRRTPGVEYLQTIRPPGQAT